MSVSAVQMCSVMAWKFKNELLVLCRPTTVYFVLPSTIQNVFRSSYKVLDIVVGLLPNLEFMRAGIAQSV